MSGWAVYRQQPSTAVWGGTAAVSNVPVFAVVSSSGWAVYRSQPSTAVWGGIAAVSNVAPAPTAAAVTLGGFQDRRPGYLKKRILLGFLKGDRTWSILWAGSPRPRAGGLEVCGFRPGR